MLLCRSLLMKLIDYQLKVELIEEVENQSIKVNFQVTLAQMMVAEIHCYQEVNTKL
jgi:hypothetical protein